MYVSHFFEKKLPTNDEITFFATLWILIYPEGSYLTYNYYEAKETHEMILECGGYCDFHHTLIHCTKDKFPDVFNACLHRQSEQVLYKQSL